MASDIREWLEGLGLAKFASAFTDQEIVLRGVQELTEADLKEMGLPIGPRRRVLKAIAGFGAQTSSKVAGEAVEAEPPSPTLAEAERRQLTVMFVDLVGSTAFSDQLDPEDYRHVITSFQ